MLRLVHESIGGGKSHNGPISTPGGLQQFILNDVEFKKNDMYYVKSILLGEAKLFQFILYKIFWARHFCCKMCILRTFLFVFSVADPALRFG